MNPSYDADRYKNDPSAHLWKLAIDDALVCDLMTTCDAYPNTVEGARRAINDLIGYNITIALDPRVGGAAPRKPDSNTPSEEHDL